MNRVKRYARLKATQLHGVVRPYSTRIYYEGQYRKEQLKRCSRAFLCCDTAFDIVGLIFGIISFIVVVAILFGVTRLLDPRCPVSPEGRECNARGDCRKGLCYCNTLYSGVACTETAVPGYLFGPNLECNGNGEANPFIDVPAACAQGINNRGQRVGPGWADPGCIEYLTQVQERLDEAGGNPLAVPEAVGLPMCLCRIPYAGKSCDRNGCPQNLNGQVCAGHGNTTVGLFRNGTREGTGCQCDRLTGFFEEPYVSSFTPAARKNITDLYYTLFNQPYCGTILISSSDPDVQYLWQQGDDYKCYCFPPWIGTACTEGACPYNP